MIEQMLGHQEYDAKYEMMAAIHCQLDLGNVALKNNAF